MVTFTPETQARIEADRRERTSRLASQASHLQTEEDSMHAGGYIVRNPRVPGRIEVVSPTGECSCRQFTVWGRCKHAALVEERYGIRS